ncbi:uncharacterized protein LOC120846222 [Ixodes scapularis]|uniref:uncharacterized protein LOC120846222 n=1 Tax=Ixodes scapularis TaxID=6945 RepID=UPI001A9E1017|nr:uncharacterized protein LOC120846222 [Ixodes scapularis]
MKHLGIKDRHTVPYRPAGQMVDRHNATVKQCLVAYCHDHCDWDQRIPEVSFAMRTCESVTTGYTPAFLCYGRQLRKPWEQNPGQLPTPDSRAPGFVAEVTSRLQDAHEFALENQRRAQEQQRRYYDRNRRQCNFRIGDLVLRDLHTLSDASKGVAAKLAPRRSGPFVAVGKVGLNDYRLKDRNTGRPAGLAHADQLLKFCEDRLNI